MSSTTTSQIYWQRYWLLDNYLFIMIKHMHVQNILNIIDILVQIKW